MRLGVQFTGEVPANSTKRWFTFRWPQEWRVIWMVVPTGPVQDSAPQIHWTVNVERQTAEFLKYWIEITNTTGDPVQIEARYAVLE